MTGPDGTLSELEIEELLGAYALDALEPDERDLVEQHLKSCVRCLEEVARYHETAGLLANSGGPAPDQVWDGIAERLDGAVPAVVSVPSWDRLAARLVTPEGADGSAVQEQDRGSKVVPISSGRRRSRIAAAVAGAVAMAAALAAVLLGVQVHHLDRQVSALSAPSQAITTAAQTALEDPGTQRVKLTPPPTSTAPGNAVVTVVLAKSGTDYLIARGLAPLPPQETYQLWGSISGQLISLGVLGAHPGTMAFSFDSNVKVQVFAITAEQAGGVAQSHHLPLVDGSVTA